MTPLNNSILPDAVSDIWSGGDSSDIFCLVIDHQVQMSIRKKNPEIN